MKRRHGSLFESLEPRKLFAVNFINAHAAAYTDVDGDLVTIKISAGDLHDALFTLVAQGLGEYLESMALPSAEFAGANLSLSVSKANTGDGRADVGLIDASNFDLGAVSIAGDLGRILAGSGNPAIPAVGSLRVGSMGQLGLANQPGGAVLPLASTFNGRLGRLVVTRDATNVAISANSIGTVQIGGSFTGGGITTTGNVDAIRISGSFIGTGDNNSAAINIGGNLGSFVAGSVVGAGGNNSASLLCNSNIGRIVVRQDIDGGAGAGSGRIIGAHSIKLVYVGGSVFGGAGVSSGGIGSATDPLDHIRIVGGILGGSGDGSGAVETRGAVQTAVVGGSVIGGSGTGSGTFTANARILVIAGDVVGSNAQFTGVVQCGNSDSIKIGGSIIGGGAVDSGEVFGGIVKRAVVGGNIIGGSASGADSLHDTGILLAWDFLSLTVGGSIRAGTDNSTGTLDRSGAVAVLYLLGDVIIKGSLVGSVGNGGDVTPVLIAAAGPLPGGSQVAIRSLTVGGRVERTNILAGYIAFNSPTVDPLNDIAQIGRVNIGGDLIASNIVAGITNTASNNLNFGDANDASANAGNLDPIASINSVTVGGRVLGTPDNASDHFGIVAQSVKSVKIAGVAVPLDPEPEIDDVAIGIGNDFNIHEV